MKVWKSRALWVVLPLSLSLIASTAPLAAKRTPPNPETAKQNGGDYWLGKKIYGEICFSCHGVKGDGKGPISRTARPRPQVFISPYMKRMTDDYMFAVVKFGKMNVLKNRTKGHKVNNGVPTAMPAFSEALEEEQIRKLIRWVRGFTSGKPPRDDESEEMFADACAQCHGKNGRGNGTRPVEDQDPEKPFISHVQPPPMNYHLKEQMARFDNRFLFWLIKLGRIDASEMKKYDFMNAYGHVLSDREIWSVIRYVRETFINGNPGTEKTGERPAPPDSRRRRT